MRKSVFSILQTLVGPYSKPLLSPSKTAHHQDVNDSLHTEQTHPKNECTPGPRKHSAGSRNLNENDGEIGYSKNSVFYPMTNFSLACVGYVVDHINSKSTNSLLFSIIALAQRIRRVALATQHKSA